MKIKNLKNGANIFCFDDLGDFCNNLEKFMANDDASIQKGLSIFVTEDAEVIISNMLNQQVEFDFEAHCLRESFVQVFDFCIHENVDILVYDLVLKSAFSEDDFE